MGNIFELSSRIDHDKVFIVDRSEIGGRLDPYYYQPRFDVIEETLSSIKNLNIKKCSEKIFSGVTPLSRGSAYTGPDGIPFIRSGDYTEDNTINFAETNYITHAVHDKLMSGSKLKKHDLLIAIVGATIGKVGVYNYDYEANINQAICGVRFKSDVNPFFVQIYLLTGFGQLILDRLKRPVARANINLEEVGSIPIPIMPPEKQHRIVSYYYEQITLKLQKEAERKALLDSIDDYLLGELGMTLPQNNNSLSNRIFTTDFSKIAGERIDPNYRLKYTYLTNQQCIYPFVRLRDVMNDQPQYGANEEAIDGEIANGIRYIRITDIDDYGNLKADGWKTAANIEEKYILNKDDILFARSGSVGRCYIHKETDKEAIFAGYLIRFVLNENLIIPDFMFYYCNSAIYKFWVDAVQRPAVQSNINAEEYKSLPIALPPIKKQKEIANHISRIRAEAKALQQEGQEILNNAKKEVERMILGV